jgi:hypothetical protein
VPRKRTIEPSEHAIQAAFIEWVYRVENLPQYHALRLSFSVPNGARVGIGQARKLKAEGMRAGVFDWWLPVAMPIRGERWTGLEYKGLCCEFKTRLGRLSKAQRDYRVLLESVGWRVAVCSSTEEAIAVVNDYLGVKP